MDGGGGEARDAQLVRWLHGRALCGYKLERYGQTAEPSSGNGSDFLAASLSRNEAEDGEDIDADLLWVDTYKQSGNDFLQVRNTLIDCANNAQKIVSPLSFPMFFLLS